MVGYSFFKIIQRSFLAAIVVLTTLSCLILSYGSFTEYQEKTRRIEESALNSNKSLLRRNIQNIRSLAEAKISNIENGIKENIFYRVQEAIDIAHEIYSRNNQDKAPDAVKNLIRDSLRSIRFNRGTGYYFIENFKNETIFLYPPKPEFEGQPFTVLGKAGAAVTDRFVYLIKTFGDGFHSYWWPKIKDQNSLYEKISFVKRFDPYDWYIGTGLYVDDFIYVIQDEIVKDVQAFYLNDQSYLLFDQEKNILVGDPAINNVEVLAFRPGEFHQIGNRLYYSELIKDIDWSIAATVDLSFINQEIVKERKKAKEIVVIQLVLIISATFILSIIFFWLIKKINDGIQDSFDLFSETFRQSATTNQTIPENNIHYSEFEKITKTANRMIEENKLIKDGLNEYKTRLEELVEERTTELKDAQEMLLAKERLALLGQLTATVSHELRNPLGAINNSLHNLEHALDENETEVARKAIRLSERSIKRCERIIDELLDYNRKGELEPEQVAIDELINETLDELLWPEDVTLKKDLSCQARVDGDGERLRRAILNLVINAQQALQDTRREEKKILVAAKTTGNNVEITIEDNGPGIAVNLRDKIFEPLFSTKNFGVGLGMTIVRDIVHQHHGEISLHDPDETGCRFVIRLPLSKGQ